MFFIIRTNWTVYNTSNSGLPDNYITSLAIDESGIKWIGTRDGGLAKFDGTNWTVYKTSDSGLPNDWVLSITIDGMGIKWIGTRGGLAVDNEGGVVSVVENKANISPTDFVLYQNYPNPFNPTTSISFQIPKAGNVVIKIFDTIAEKYKS